MKKILLTLSAMLVTTIALFAQLAAPSQPLSLGALRNGVDFKSGFSYFNRDGVANGTVTVEQQGVNRSNYHLVAAIQLPQGLNGTVIKGAQLIQLSTKKLTVFIAERPANSANDAAWTVIEKTEVTKPIGDYKVETVLFNTPVTTKAGKEYCVGYETQAGYNDKSKNPIVYSQEPLATSAYANLFNYQDNKGSNIINNKVSFINTASYEIGNLIIIALCDDTTSVLSNPFYLPKDEVKGIKRFGNSISAEENAVKVYIGSMNNEKPTSATIEVTPQGGSTQTVETQVANNLANVKLGALSTFGDTRYKLVLKKVNGKAVSLTDETLNSCTYIVRLYDPQYSFMRPSIFVEFFSTENCGNCPFGEHRLYEALKMVDFPVIVGVHHVGYGTDFLTQPGDEKFMWNCFIKRGYNAATPCMTINRTEDSKFLKITTLEPKDVQGMIILIPGPTDIANLFKYMYDKVAEASIQTISRKKEGSTYTYTIEGRVSNKEENKEDAYITMYLTQDNVIPQKQAGAGPDFLHNDAIRKIITPIQGQKITCNADGTYSVKIKGVNVPTGDDVEDMHFVFILHRNPYNKDYSKRYVYASAKMNVATEQGVSELPSEDAPQAYAQNGHIYIKGMADSFVVYSISGEQVATSSNEQLPQGIYIVRIQLADSFYTSKVVVK